MSDLISRQDAIDAIERLILPQTKGETVAEEINRVVWRCAINCAEELIVHLPSAQPEITVDRALTEEGIKDIKQKMADSPIVFIPSSQPEPQWIPCSERLPKERGFYLVSVGAPYKTVRVYEYKPCEGYENENLWKSDDGSYCFNWFVKAWMPLPEPYREEQNDE